LNVNLGGYRNGNIVAGDGYPIRWAIGIPKICGNVIISTLLMVLDQEDIDMDSYSLLRNIHTVFIKQSDNGTFFAYILNSKYKDF
jgi:hypothetical protein